MHFGYYFSGSAQPGWRGPSPSRPFGPRVKQGIPPPLGHGGLPANFGGCRRQGPVGSGRRASPGGGGPDLGYEEVRGSPMIADGGGMSSVEVDVGERPEKGSKSESERSASSTLAR
jgi:hypothetical protein